MQVSVAFRHMDASESLQSYASGKLEHVIDKYIHGQDVDSQVVFSTERFWQIANFTININGLTVKSVERSENMYSSVDLALDRVERQLRRYKDRIRSHKPASRKRQFTMDVIAPQAAEAAAEFDAEDDTYEFDAGSAPEAESPVTVVKHESYDAPFMTPEQAVMQLNLRASHFFVFTNQWTERINIIHRRDDGGYGLIDPAT